MNDEYWVKRFLALEEYDKNKTEEYYASVSLAFTKTIEAIEAEIDKWFRKYAKSQNVSYVEAKKILTANELKEFKMSLAEYQQKALDPKWLKQLERVSARVHISRLEMLEYQLVELVQELFAEYAESVPTHLESTYNYQYYHTGYEIAKGTHEGMMLSSLAKEEVKKVIGKAWAADGKVFSERIWGDRDKLVNEVHVIITRGMAMGQGSWDMTDALAKRMNVSHSNAARLIATETAAVRSAAQADSMKETEVEQYKFVATLDRKTSAVCRAADGKVFNLTDRKVGINAPPMHPRCRSTTIPYYGMTYGSRAARDKDGKTIYVPASMTYEEWYKKFIV